MKSARPLDRFAAIDTCDLDETRAALARIYARPTLELIGRERTLRAMVNHCQLEHVALCYPVYAGKLRMRFPETDLAALILSIEGTAEALVSRTSVSLASNRSIVIFPGEAWAITSHVGYQRLIPSVSSTALASKLSASTGASCGVLKFDPIQNCVLPAAKALPDHFLFLVGKLSASTAPLPKFDVGGIRTGAHGDVSSGQPTQLQSLVGKESGRCRSAAGAAGRGIHRSECAADRYFGTSRGGHRRERFESFWRICEVSRLFSA